MTDINKTTSETQVLSRRVTGRKKHYFENIKYNCVDTVPCDSG